MTSAGEDAIKVMWDNGKKVSSVKRSTIQLVCDEDEGAKNDASGEEEDDFGPTPTPNSLNAPTPLHVPPWWDSSCSVPSSGDSLTHYRIIANLLLFG